MSDLAAPPPIPPYPPYAAAYKDRSALLVVVGILEICLGLFCLLLLFFIAMAGLSVKALPQAQQAQVDPRSLLVSSVLYLLIAAFFFVMGIGTLRARRWARSLMLVFSWTWLTVGVVSVIAAAALLPRMLSAMAANMPPESRASFGPVAGGCISVALFVLYIALPGLMLLFYRGPNVRATFEARDPSVPWTDRVPGPVLAMTVLMALAAASGLTGFAYGAFPLFGHVLTGIAGSLAFVVMGLLCAALAWGFYHRRSWAWWTLVALTAVGIVNGVLMLKNGAAGFRSLYEAMGIPPFQMAQMEAMGVFSLWTNPVVLGLLAIFWLAWVGFLVWMKRFFREPAIQYTERDRSGVP